MSVDYHIFLRERPVFRWHSDLKHRDKKFKFAPPLGDDDDLDPLVLAMRDEGWFFGGLAIDIEPWHPDHPLRYALLDHSDPERAGEVRWVVSASGGSQSYDWNSWDIWSEDLASRCRGAIYSPMGEGSFRWIEGDDAPEPGEPESDDAPGPGEASGSSGREPPDTALQREASPDPGLGLALRALRNRVAEAPLAELFPEVLADAPSANVILARIKRERGATREFFAFLLARARLGAACPGCLRLNDRSCPWQIPMAAPEAKSEARREAFAASGGLAQAIVAQWKAALSRNRRLREQKAQEQRVADLREERLEIRRRAGERLVPLPDDILALAVSGKLEKASSQYARRYSLPIAFARDVVRTMTPAMRR